MLIPSGYAQANLKFGGTGLPNGAEVTIGLDMNVVLGTPSAIASLVIGAYNDNVDPIMTGSVTLESVLVKFGPNDTGPSAEVASGNSGSGGGSGTSPAVSWLVRKVTPFGGKAGRGRMYWPGVQESEVDVAGVLSSGFVSGAQTAMDNFLADLIAADIPPVVLHGAGSPLTTPSPITSLEVDNVVATQRRRQRK
jgi:hypothetical protein